MKPDGDDPGERETTSALRRASLREPRSAALNLPITTRHLQDVGKRERQTLAEIRSRLTSTYVPQAPVVLSGNISPAVLIENRPAYVEFFLYNNSRATLSDCRVRARIEPKHSIKSYPGLFEFDVSQLEDHGVLLGAISVTLPRADLGNVLTLELYRRGDGPGEFPPDVILATFSTSFDVGARFSIELYSIFIRDTAAHNQDTVLATISGISSDGATWSDARNLGDHNNTGRGGIPSGLRSVGPFDMLPNDSKSVAVGVVIANAGHTSDEEEARKVLEALSDAGAVAATVIMSIVFPFGAGVWAALSAAIDALHHAILDYAFADCDTVVLNDGFVATSDRLYLNTQDANDQKSEAYPAEWIKRHHKKAGDQNKISDWLGGGCRDSDYTALFQLTRHRVPEMFHNVGSDGTLLAPGQIASFGPLTNFTPAAVTYENLYEGKVDEHGEFLAPASVSQRKYDIVKWTVYRDMPELGIQEAFEDFAVVILD